MKLIRFDYVSYVRKANTYYNAMRAPVDKLDNCSNNLMKSKILMNVAVCVCTHLQGVWKWNDRLELSKEGVKCSRSCQLATCN